MLAPKNLDGEMDGNVGPERMDGDIWTEMLGPNKLDGKNMDGNVGPQKGFLAFR